MNYLMSPPLVVAYALAGTVDIDLTTEPLGTSTSGADVYLRDIWPSREEIDATLRAAVRSDMFTATYETVFDGDERWRRLDTPTGERFEWDPASTYVRRPPFLTGITAEPPPVDANVVGARALAHLGDSITTDHISPAGATSPDSPSGRWLLQQGVGRADFNSYGARRGNHEVMLHGTFANGRIHNQLAGGAEGGVTVHLPDGEEMSIYDAAVRYRQEGVPLIVLAGKDTAPARLATGPRRAPRCSACAPFWPRASSASTARISSAWGCCRCSTSTASRPRPSASPATSDSTSTAPMSRSSRRG